MLAFHGMVRCGNCLQAFDARYSFVPEEPDPQLALPIPDKDDDSIESPDSVPPTAASQDLPLEETIEPEQMVSEQLESVALAEEVDATKLHPSEEIIEPEEIVLTEQISGEAASSSEVDPTVAQPIATYSEELIYPSETFSERVAVVLENEPEWISSPPASPRIWPWALANLLLLTVLLAQVAYFFRAHLVDYQPELRPMLLKYCEFLDCDVPLPKVLRLMSIESSDMEADLDENKPIILSALLRNRATFTQAFPDLELTLNDFDNKPLARRIFKPADYLPPVENVETGLLPNHEIEVRLPLKTIDLEPNGYRLALSYSQ